MKANEVGIFRALSADKDSNKVLEHTMVIQLLGSVLNIAQGVSIRENAMTNFSFKKDADQLEKIGKRLMIARLGTHNFQLAKDMEDMMHYEYGYELYRVFRHMCGKDPSYIKALADELEQKQKMYHKLMLDHE